MFFQTDVTVNSVFKSMDLKEGVLSNAILQAAGPQLQELLDAKKSSGALGDVIVTEGCQLKSAFVYHAVTPGRDTAHGLAMKVTPRKLVRASFLWRFVKERRSNCEVVLSVIGGSVTLCAVFSQTLSRIFRDCLNVAEDTGMTSISFPTIGTGRLGFPKDQVAQSLYGEIFKFSHKRQTKNLKEVTIILYSGDTETQQVKTGLSLLCEH